MPHYLEAEEDLWPAIREFTERYLFEALEQPQRGGVDTRVAAFVLLECFQNFGDNCYADLDESLRVGEQLIEGYLRDWRTSRKLSSSGH